MAAPTSYAIDARPLADARASSIQRYVRITGLLILVSIVFGYLGEMYIPSKFISSGDLAGTTQKIASSLSLYRAGFATYLVEAVCDIALAMLFYVLFRPVNKPIAMASAFFGLVSTALYGVAEAFYFIPTIWVSGAEFMKPFSAEQINALTILSLRIFGRIGWIFLGFYGIASFLRGYLMFRSEFLPKTLGALFMLGGIGFMLMNLTYVLAPAYSSSILLAPMALAAVSTMVWMLTKGVTVARWEAKAG